MNNELYRLQGIKGVIELIKTICEKHDAVSEFQIGVQLETDKSKKLYPVAFLESDITSDVEGDSETFSFALSVGDRLPHDYTSDDAVIGKSKTSQILDEIHYAIENVASNILVTGMNKMYYEDVNQDSLVICRGEFQIEIARFTAKNGDVYVDLPSLPEYGSTKNIIQWDSIQGKPALVTPAELTDGLATKSDSNHTHDEFEILTTAITDGLATKSNTGHTHSEFETLDEKITTGLATKSDSGHNHDDRYFTQDQVSNLITNITTDLEWKGSVATYGDLVTTYPVPRQGWTVTVNDTGIDYRFDGTEWIDIGNNSSPMADSDTDGRMSKEHYNIIQNLNTTHYTKADANTTFSNASLLTSGTVADARLSTNVVKKNITSTFTVPQYFETGVAGNIATAWKVSGINQLVIKYGGNLEWQNATGTTDLNLYRASTNLLKTDYSMAIGGALWMVGKINNSSSDVNAHIQLPTTGVEIKTGIATNVGLKVYNYHTTPTTDIQQWLAGTPNVVVARISSNGTFFGKVDDTALSSNVMNRTIENDISGSFNIKRSAGGVAIRSRDLTKTTDQFNITVEGKMNWGDGTATTDTTLYRSGVGILKTDLDLIVGRSLYVNTISNTSSSNNAVLSLGANGSLLQTGVATNVAASIRNTATTPTGNLMEFIKTSSVVAKVDANGAAEFTGLKVNGKTYVDYSYVNPNAVVDLYDIPTSEIAKLENNANWTNNRYTGTAIVNTYQGQEYDSVTTGFWYKCVSENNWIRR